MDKESKDYLEQYKKDGAPDWKEEACCQSGCEDCPYFSPEIDPEIPRELQKNDAAPSTIEIYDGEVSE